MKFRFLLYTVLFLSLSTAAQSVELIGYAFESGNRGYLNQVSVKAYHPTEGLIASTTSNKDGEYKMRFLMSEGIKLIVSKDLFHDTEHYLSSSDLSKDGRIFLKSEMNRAPGYIFEITLANKKIDVDIPVDAIKGAHVEVYNNTTKKEILNLKDLRDPDFKINLLKGNHYTLLIRKEGYLTKRMEAYVDVEGCILCFEGIGDVRPEVSDNLTGGNNNGTLLANVELDPLYIGQKIEIEKIYYDLDKWSIRKDAAVELDKVGVFLKDNPRLRVELGSHTDSRGKAAYNTQLSQRRAEAAISYLRTYGGVSKKRTSFKGYGESQLVNHCGDGVKCTEQEHQQNRRTELKILGIGQAEVYKSLLEMKTEEHMESILEELSKEGQIRIPAGVDVPLDLQKELDSQSKITKESNHQATATLASQKLDNGAVNKTINKIEPTKYKGQDQAYNSNLNNYMIAIHTSNKALTKEHKLFKKHNELAIYNESGVFYYLIGDFDSEKEASKFLNAYVKREYPKASLMFFRKGVRIK